MSNNVTVQLVTALKAAELLGISRAHFYRMHNAGRVPLPIRLGGSVRWRVSELVAWVEAGMPNRQKWQSMTGCVK
ncbi:MAG: helix-turn-helix domain-containing protein [Phycisphaeraceae bacterium]|nr:helix-turn-helix domain-containing protein [Phycisphaeraceae bacterium]